ncbi:hypothetical protein THMIRHAS_24460 [Thiosulfatimonas sediminis]|uniref:Uncharacterized protein n=1 Tax=Thiosulfatimonas sediminis TaxID=2675054 RepID=A0A6F8PY52_9GAMM|nr:hypothetical protein THMIRHAS_24460 [Thiosulfatimonas sediminis]
MDKDFLLSKKETNPYHEQVCLQSLKEKQPISTTNLQMKSNDKKYIANNYRGYKNGRTFFRRLDEST